MYRRSLLNLIVPAALLLGCNSALAESRLALGKIVRDAPVRSGTEFSAMFGQKHS